MNLVWLDNFAGHRLALHYLLQANVDGIVIEDGVGERRALSQGDGIILDAVSVFRGQKCYQVISTTQKP